MPSLTLLSLIHSTKMTRNRTTEDYEKKYDVIDESMKKDYEGYLKICGEYLDTVSNVLASTKVRYGLS